MFAKDGLGIIIGSFVVFLLSLGIWYIFPSTVALVVTAIFGIFSTDHFFGKHTKTVFSAFSYLTALEPV